MKQLTFDELGLEDEESKAQVAVWLARGDGIAVYENHDLGHPELGHRQYVSYGSPAAMLETDEPPERLPDIGNHINWRYILIGVHRPEKESETPQIRIIRQADIRRCPHLIVNVSHYREDGTCRCGDPEHTEMAEWGYKWEDGLWR